MVHGRVALIGDGEVVQRDHARAHQTASHSKAQAPAVQATRAAALCASGEGTGIPALLSLGRLAASARARGTRGLRLENVIL
jgi:hypothetical protein